MEGNKQIRQIRKIKKANRTEAIQFTIQKGLLPKPEKSGEAF